MIQVDTNARQIYFGQYKYNCQLGIGGVIAKEFGREGDEKTPLGCYKLRFGLYRPDRLATPSSQLTFRALRPDDGWCDSVDDPAYNRLIRLPYPARHEKLWREDSAYDIILVMNHNDSPPVPGLGSAVFIHIVQPDHRETLGCIALELEAMMQLLPLISVGTDITIHESRPSEPSLGQALPRTKPTRDAHE